MALNETTESLEKLETPENFEFPFPAYDIQADFMRRLYRTLEDGKCGIFESPTGTGKSLSMICGAVRWLKDHNAHVERKLIDKISALTSAKLILDGESSPGDWITSQSKGIEISRKIDKLRFEKEKIENYNKKLDEMKEGKRRLKKKYPVKRKDENEKPSEEEDDDDVLIEDVTLTDLDRDEEQDKVEETDKYAPTKIFICSRTHSQLSQLIGEIKKSPFAADVRAVSLASRQIYCVNPSVSRFKNVALINERCLDMQKQLKSTKDGSGKIIKRQKGSNCKCLYYKQDGIEDLRDVALFDVPDVEDLVTAGKEIQACPYYASRKAVEHAELVLVPYNTILHKATREANGIVLKNNVVIVDEAHNLLEAMSQMHNVEVTRDQLHHSRLQLKAYKAKYSSRFSAQSLACINRLVLITTNLLRYLDKKVQEKNDCEKVDVHMVASFVNLSAVNQFNMLQLVKFVRETKLAQKLHSFALRNPDVAIEEKPPKKGVKNFLASIENSAKQPPVVEIESPKLEKSPPNPLLPTVSFLETLTNVYEDGRVMVHRGTVNKFKFLLLNPSEHFKDVVRDCRAVIVAGGTMKPMAEFRDRLFLKSGASEDRIEEFSCGHIVPPENILPIVLPTGSNGETLCFNYESRLKMAGQLRCVLTDVCKHVTGGVVVFFPSYKYETWVWEQLKNVNFSRPVFREPQNSGSVDTVLEAYDRAIKRPGSKGAMLFSVVGGKLSEGLNFNDDLGRCVIVVGLPYANINSPELKEKMSYLDKTEGVGAGNKFYQNQCMKAVNQCVGRAVRHKDDYAVVLLLDDRYERASSKKSLPDWIQRSLQTCKYQQAFETIKEFFNRKR